MIDHVGFEEVIVPLDLRETRDCQQGGDKRSLKPERHLAPILLRIALQRNPPKVGGRFGLAKRGEWRIMLVAGAGVRHQLPPRTYLRRFRVHRIRTVIRPNSTWAAFISTRIIGMILLSASIGEPGPNRAFLYEASIREPASPISTEGNLIVAVRDLKSWRSSHRG